jgi:hypothetical protein
MIGLVIPEPLSPSERLAFGAVLIGVVSVALMAAAIKLLQVATVTRATLAPAILET